MMTCSRVRWCLLAGLLAVTVSGCGGRTWREYVGLPAQRDPSVALKTSEPKWLLIKNPRCCDVASEPEYIWVEEDKVPTTMKSLVFGKSTLLAPPEIVARYGSPPGGGRISPRQGGAYKVENVTPTAGPELRRASAVVTNTTRTDAPSAIAPTPTTRGYVVFVDTSRVVIDLAAADGVKVGSTVSVRRDKIAIVHPITGELLGELDEEVATGRVVEVREKFSVVEVQKAAAGAQIQVKDRVVLR
ncbi:MAG TPA: FlgT C-terminal domain-containing protein [Methylomirabilota bacterium]|nr:FlgT C-terminal domain-containing protein [Methylomirabilota bacterium]